MVKYYIFLLSTIIFFVGCTKQDTKQEKNNYLIHELTTSEFEDGPKFNSDGTFNWSIDNGPQISGEYKIGKLHSWENEGGHVGMRHLNWTITFTDVQGGEYWDEDNSMTLSFDWNHPRSKNKFILRGNSRQYPIEFYKKVINSDSLILKYWKPESK